VSAPLQPDLFGEYDAAEQARRRRRHATDGWRARFEHVTVTIAYESTGGDKPGDQLAGVVCPACGGIEFNDYLLSINHGWDPSDFEQARYGLYGRPAFETCTKLEYGDGHKRDIDPWASPS